MIAETPTSQITNSRVDGTISVVLPVFNEDAILMELNRRVVKVMESTGRQFEIIYVNDGSSDRCPQIMDQLACDDQRVAVVHLSRNFGHQAAVHAGLEHASGDAIIVMDSDLQDNPSAIPRFIDEWTAGYDVVYAERFNRKESLPKRTLFYGFYRVLNGVSDTKIPEDAGNFGLLDRAVLNHLLSLPESDRYFPGLRSWLGFRQTGVPVERDARHDDQPRVSMAGLFRLAKTAIFSFSAAPLTLFYGIACLSGLVCLGAIGFVLYHKTVTGLAIPGWASTIITASFFGSLNALGISILGEYVIRIYDQVRNRPIYLARDTRNIGLLTKTDSSQSPSSCDRPLSTSERKGFELLEQIQQDLNTSHAQDPAPADKTSASQSL